MAHSRGGQEGSRSKDIEGRTTGIQGVEGRVQQFTTGALALIFRKAVS